MDNKRKNKKPSRIILWILSKQKRFDKEYSSCGDFLEYYHYIHGSYNWLKATLLCWINLLVLSLGYFKATIAWEYFMLKENFKITLRGLRKNKTYSIINITGLAVGMACTILIMLWVQDELHYNQFNKKIDDIYWVSEWINHNGISSSLNGSVTALGPSLKENYPEILDVARYMNGTHRFLTQYKDKSFFEEIRIGDFSIFKIFTFPVVEGIADPDRSDAQVIMLSQKMAKKYFANENPIGKFLTLDNKHDLRVVGVFKDMQRTSTIKFDLIVPLEFVDGKFSSNYSFNWDDDGNQTYLLLQKGVNYNKFNIKIKDFYKVHDKDNRWPVIYPFKKFYLEEWGRGQKTTVQIFSIVAILILFIACINYMNLSTAQSLRRAKEVGLRKVVGAEPRQLIRQFLCESTFYSFSGILFACFLVVSSLPGFSEITGKQITIQHLCNIKMLGGIVILTILTGLISGSYPAFFLSSFSPGVILKDSEKSAQRKSVFRKILVIGQFVVSIGLITCSLFIFKQIDYLQTENWGFEKEDIIYFHLEGNLKKQYQVLKNELLTHPRFLSVTATSHTPGGVWAGQSGWEWEGKDPTYHLWARVFNTDPDFLETFNLKMERGKFFSKEANNKNQVVINETLAQKIKLRNPIGKYIKEKSVNDNIPSQIIGIIKNYHIAPFNTKIAPLIIFPNFKWGDKFMNYRFMFVKTRPGNISETISILKKIVKKHNPDYPVNCQFYEPYFDNLYKKEKVLDKVVRVFTLLAIFISCLGLFGLALFSSEQRRKEIGIRKVMGASSTSIMVLLSKQFLKLVVISCIIAIPIAYYFIQKWLDNFAYKFEPGLELFIIPGLSALLIALLTISHQTIQAANANPIKSIKYE